MRTDELIAPEPRDVGDRGGLPGDDDNLRVADLWLLVQEFRPGWHLEHEHHPIARGHVDRMIGNLHGAAYAFTLVH